MRHPGVGGGTIGLARRRALEELVASAGVTVSTRTVAAMRAVAAAAGEVPDAQWWQRWEASATRGPGTWPARPAPGRRRAA